jgi:hypothetical protein
MTDHDGGIRFFRGLLYAIPLVLVSWAIIAHVVRHVLG